MSTKRLNNEQRWDFADMIATKTYRADMDKLTKNLKTRDEELMECLATPETRKNAKKLSRDLMFMRREIRLSAAGDLHMVPGDKYHRRANVSVTILLPEAVPMRINPAYQAIFDFHYSKEELLGHLSDEEKLWYVVESERRHFQDRFLSALDGLRKLTNSKIALRQQLFERLKQVSTLKQLEQVVPELHDEWCKYFGDFDGSNLPSVKFDDLLAVIKKEAA